MKEVKRDDWVKVGSRVAENGREMGEGNLSKVFIFNSIVRLI